mgnify:CR=1 FL=1
MISPTATKTEYIPIENKTVFSDSKNKCATPIRTFSSVQAQECTEEDATDPHRLDCKPLTRAEVKAEAKKAGAKIVDSGECPNYPVAKSAAGKIRTRAEVRREAAEAAKMDKVIDMGECPN